MIEPSLRVAIAFTKPPENPEPTALHEPPSHAAMPLKDADEVPYTLVKDPPAYSSVPSALAVSAYTAPLRPGCPCGPPTPLHDDPSHVAT